MRTAVAAVLVGMSLGIGMGMAHDFALAPVHAHLNLVGWVSMFLFGLFYRVVPAADTRLALVQYWFSTSGLILFNVGLTVNLLYGVTLVPGLAWLIGAVLSVVSMLIFARTVFTHTAEARSARFNEGASLPGVAG